MSGTGEKETRILPFVSYTKSGTRSKDMSGNSCNDRRIATGLFHCFLDFHSVGSGTPIWYIRHKHLWQVLGGKTSAVTVIWIGPDRNKKNTAEIDKLKLPPVYNPLDLYNITSIHGDPSLP